MKNNYMVRWMKRGGRVGTTNIAAVSTQQAVQIVKGMVGSDITILAVLER